MFSPCRVGARDTLPPLVAGYLRGYEVCFVQVRREGAPQDPDGKDFAYKIFGMCGFHEKRLRRDFPSQPLFFTFNSSELRWVTMPLCGGLFRVWFVRVAGISSDGGG